MKYAECMIAWDVETKGVKVGPWPDLTGWSDIYPYTCGACDGKTNLLTPDQRMAMAFIDFNTLVVRDGLDPQVVHAAFLAIDEYRQHISPDMQGAPSSTP